MRFFRFSFSTFLQINTPLDCGVLKKFYLLWLAHFLFNCAQVLISFSCARHCFRLLAASEASEAREAWLLHPTSCILHCDWGGSSDGNGGVGSCPLASSCCSGFVAIFLCFVWLLRCMLKWLQHRATSTTHLPLRGECERERERERVDKGKRSFCCCSCEFDYQEVAIIADAVIIVTRLRGMALSLCGRTHTQPHTHSHSTCTLLQVQKVVAARTNKQATATAADSTKNQPSRHRKVRWYVCQVYANI